MTNNMTTSMINSIDTAPPRRLYSCAKVAAANVATISITVRFTTVSYRRD
jgi:hypothetical protein